MSNSWTRDRATPFYLSYGLAGLLVVALGFGITYAAPIARGDFAAPWFVHLHGIAALTWVLAVVGQAALVRAGQTRWHRKAGQSALPLAVFIWASGIATAGWAATRDLPQLGSAATSALAGTFTGLTIFVVLVGAAIATRKRSDWHKRIVLLATIHVLWPAFFRLRHWFPAVPDPEIWLALVLAYSPIVMAGARDRWKFGKVHPVWSIVAPVLVAEQTLEAVYFDRGIHQAFGRWLFAWIA